MLKLVILVVLALFFNPALAKDDELKTRTAVQANAAVLWQAKDLAGIERLALIYSKERTRSPSGIWMRSVLNDAMSREIEKSSQTEGWASLETRARKWAASSKTSPIAQLFLADVLFAHGYAIRGVEFASRTPEPNMVQFMSYVRQAREQLERVKPIAAIDPCWYEFMIKIAKHENWSDARFEALFFEATQKEPDYFQTYFAASGNYAPTWGGSIDKLNAFVIKSISRLSTTQADAMYTRIYWFVSENYFYPFGVGTFDCARMMRGARIVARDFPEPWNINHFALFAYTCDDKASFTHFEKLLGGVFNPGTWEGASIEAAQQWSQEVE